MMQLEFDDDGDGVVTLDEFTDKCCNNPGMMAEPVAPPSPLSFVFSSVSSVLHSA